MRLGMNLSFANSDGTSRSVAEVMADARAVEEAGFDGIWIGDTIGRHRMEADPLMWLTVAAAATTHVELGTAVVQVPLRNPVELARRVLTLHALARGRFTFGVGAGSNPIDFAALGVDFEQRFKMLKSALAVMEGLFQGERVGEADLRTWPDTRGGPPIIVGAWASGIWVKRAAQHYAGWMSSGSRTNFDVMADGIKRYRDFGGKRAIVSTINVDIVGGAPRPDTEGLFTLYCTPAEGVERLQRVADLGYDDVLFKTADRSPANLAAIRALVPRHAGTAAV